ncbi:Uncharacterised protein [Vibrio cholerae]|nr:Uncharacterised protein [Vibrio cholerae]
MRLDCQQCLFDTGKKLRVEVGQFETLSERNADIALIINQKYITHG